MFSISNLKKLFGAAVLGLSFSATALAQEHVQVEDSQQARAAEVAQVTQMELAQNVVSPQNNAPRTVGLGGNNAWDYIVFGNGPQIYEILQSIKGFLVPNSGDSGFRTLLLFVSIIGVVLLAVQAGFNPVFGFPKLVFFILAAGFISITTFQMRVNLTIADPVRNYNQTVSGVPFIVGAPVAVISSVGMYFTRSVETQLTIPDSFKMVGASSGSGGKFNLFGDMLSELDKFQFSSANLKAHISTYMLDCGIHGISRGKITADELMNSPALMDTLKKVGTEAVLTKKFSEQPTNGGVAYSVPTQELTTCRDSLAELEKSAKAEANALFTVSSEQLAGSGVNVLAETAMTDLLSALGANAGGIGGVSTISGRAIALQKGFADYTGKAFSDAAQLTGNSDLLMAVQVAQQEQAQKTSWVIGVKMFNNIMGYLFTVLQAFILALFPIMIVAFLIPGIGKKLMINMFQLLLWQALWLPGLAIVNYLVFVFGTQEVSVAYYSASGGSGGFTINNSALISEAAANATLAASFLSTLIPIITWGLVKGTLAFSEFIGGGIGQSLASSAGSSVAGGNLSQGQISQNQVSANKFNTATSFTSGAMDPTAYLSSAPLASMGKGGQMQTAAGGTNTVAQEQTRTITSSASLSEDVRRDIQAKQSAAAQQSSTSVQSAMEGMSGSAQKKFMTFLQMADDLVKASGGSHDKAIEKVNQMTNGTRAGESKNTSQDFGVGVKAAIQWAKDLAGLDVNGSAGANLQLVRQAANEAAANTTDAAKEGRKTSESLNQSNAVKRGDGSDELTSFQTEASKKVEAALAKGTTEQWSREIGSGISEGVGRQLVLSLAKQEKMSVNGDNWGGKAYNPDEFNQSYVGGQEQILGAEERLNANFRQMEQTANDRFKQFQSQAQSQFQAFSSGAQAYEGMVIGQQDKLALDAEARGRAIEGGLQANASRVISEKEGTDGKTRAIIQTMNESGTSMFSYAVRNEDGSFKMDNGKLVTATDYQAVVAAGGAGAIIGGKVVGELVPKGVNAVTGLGSGLANAVTNSAGGATR